MPAAEAQAANASAVGSGCRPPPSVAGEVALRVGVRRAGDVAREIRVARAAVDEAVVHDASLTLA